MRKEFWMPTIAALLLATTVSLPLTAHAETLGVADDVTTLDTVVVEGDPERVPNRGASQSAVLHDFGEPDIRHPSAGGTAPRQPPITRWDYPSFSVFFERRNVVDVVIKDKPAPIRHIEELQSAP